MTKRVFGTAAARKQARAAFRAAGGGTPSPTLGVLALVGTLTQGVAATGVTITGATAGSTITLSVAGLTVNGSGTTRTVSGTPTAAGALSASEALAGATNTPRGAGIGTVGGALPTAAPLAPTVTAANGRQQALLTIADDPASQQVRKWGVYRSSTSGGALTFLGWCYTKDQVHRSFLTNGTTSFYRVSAWNAYNGGTEGVKSVEVSATAAAANFNPLRLLGVEYYAGQLFYAQVGRDYKAGSTLSVSCSDGTTLEQKVLGGDIFFFGTFATGGQKVLTWSETPSGGGAANVSTQTINVIARPTAVALTFKPVAQGLKARRLAAPTYSTAGTLTATDMGATMPAGYTGSKVLYPGKSIYPGNVYTAIEGFDPPQYGVTGYDPVEQIPVNNVLSTQAASTNNGVFRISLTKQTWVVGLTSDQSSVVGHHKPRYTTDNGQTWTEMVDPIYIKGGSGAHYMKLDCGFVPTGRVQWELESSSYAYYTNSQFTNGFGFEPGEVPMLVVDDSPVIAGSLNSFENGVGSTDQTRNSLRTLARREGVVNVWNLGIPSHRWALGSLGVGALGVDRIGKNVLGIGDLDMPPRIDLWDMVITINDFGLADVAQAKATFINVLLRARRLRPTMIIVVSIGFWAPQNRIDTPLYNAIKAAVEDVMATDKGVFFNDGVAQGWAIASGATGSAPNAFHSAATVAIMAGTSGTTLTVGTGSGVEVGMHLFNGTTYLRARVLRQLPGGTPGGAGTYQLDVSPSSGDIAGGTSLTLSSEDGIPAYPVHPHPGGQVWMGNRKADGAEVFIDQLAA